MRKFFSNLLRKITSRYEAGERFTHGKSYIPAWVQDARFDANSASRLELLRKARYWERNNAIVNRLADVFEQYTVGLGLNIIPSSSDREWNKKAKAYWLESCRFLNLCSRHNFGVDQSLIARSWFIDGEVFIYKTRGQTGFPRIQLIESHRVATPGDIGPDANVYDGVEVDPNGRPIAYHVLTGVQSDGYQRIPADNIIHIFEPSRIGQYRGIPFLYSVLNDIHDLDDLQMLEQKAAKEAAEITNVVKNAAGELSPDKLRQERYQTARPMTNGVDTLEQRAEYVRRSTGARTIALKTGEDISQFRSERPSVAMQGYWDYVAQKICVGCGIPIQLVFPRSMQGTVARGDLDVAAQFFKIRSAVLQAAFTEIYLYVMDFGRNKDKTIADAPHDWRLVKVRPPRSPNVDVGRNSNAMLAELKSGATTYERIFGELGEDWVEQINQRAREIAEVKEIAELYGVDPAEITDTLIPVIQAKAMEANIAQGAGNDPEADPAEQVEPSETATETPDQ